MSTTTTLADASQSASTPTETSAQSDTDTATLYLFTFLATILILVLLSASLVLRSYILRRRYRRRIQRALTDALFVDLDRSALSGVGQFGLRRPSRRFGPKPDLWNTWIHPVDEHSWSAFRPVAVHCIPSTPPSSLISSPRPSTTPPSQRHTSALLAQLRLPGPYRPSPYSSSPRQARTPARSPILSTARSPPPPSAPISANLSTQSDKGAATLAVCVLVAMPDVSAPVHRPVPDAKGKGVDTLESPQPSPDADSRSSSSLPRSGARIPDFTLDEDGLPLLEFGVAEVKAEGWVYRPGGA